MSSTFTPAERTVSDFGEQWSHFTTNEGYYASLSLFRDLVEPLIDVDELRGCAVADIGSGTGRIVNMLFAAGAARVVAIEPSAAFDVLRANTVKNAHRISYLRATGDRLPPTGDLDAVVSFGVLHHIPNPVPAVRAAYAALRPGGRLLAWLYGHEGNELYLGIVRPLRSMTKRLPHGALRTVSTALTAPLTAYGLACNVAPLPMHQYMCGHINKLRWSARVLTIYDQLNPAWAKYYRRHEAEALLEDAGFRDVRLHHRHGYSWTVIGTKPGSPR
jgi:SAM-dependent methyltransferase